MIPYNESHFGIPLLIRINGSALVQAIFPALASTLIFYGIVFGYYAGENLEDMSIAQVSSKIHIVSEQNKFALILCLPITIKIIMIPSSLLRVHTPSVVC